MCTVTDDWNYRIDTDIIEIEKNSFAEFETIIKRSEENVTELLESGFKRSILNFIGNVHMNDEELDVLLEANKVLRQEIEQQLENVQRQKTQYEVYKKDQKLLTKEVKDTHEAFLMAKKYYKKYLKIYYTIESKSEEKQTIFIQFFTEAKKDNDNYSVKLVRYPVQGIYELQSTQPKLKELKDLQRKLEETKDIANILSSIRKIFLSLKCSKKS